MATTRGSPCDPCRDAPASSRTSHQSPIQRAMTGTVCAPVGSMFLPARRRRLGHGSAMDGARSCNEAGCAVCSDAPCELG
ncbi:Hypothetical protein A7982_04403 [Minicystis rosea]|nr:Hypothetical protein A7982_04403 [Minicystis rosea]